MDEPEPTPPAYEYGAKNESILLQRGRFELITESSVVASGAGSISFVWLPTPRVTFEITDESLDDRLPDHVRLSGVAGAYEVDAFVRSTSIGPGLIKGTITRATFASNAQIVEVRFLVANLRFFHGEPLGGSDGDGRRSFWAGRNVMTDGQWRLTLDARPDISKVTRRLGDEGGFDVTHTASLVRVDASAFAPTEALDALNAIAGFVALIRGQWAPPLLAVGLDRTGGVVWQDWTPRHTSAWSTVTSAFDAHHPEVLEPAFTGYLGRWRSELWNMPLRIATQMYVEANGAATAETSLFLTQAALELIAWVMFVEEQQSQDEGSFEGGRASARLRDVLDWLNVSYEIPASLETLAREAQRLGWDDGPHAITETRNALAHPRRGDRLVEADTLARIELQELALWYLELALLRLIAIEGVYAARLGSRWVGDVEALPWA